MRTILCRYSPGRSVFGGPAALTIGNFDGLHRGHRSLIEEVAREKARLGNGARAIVVSFYPHPGEVVGKAEHLPRITSLHQKLEILSGWGVDCLCLIHFTRLFSQITAQVFLDDILIRSLGLSTLVIGPDARIGHKKQGTPEFMATHLKQFGKAFKVVSFVDAMGGVISSRRIRGLIEEGCVEDAAVLLDRLFAYRSRVVKGDQRGRVLGYPTANLHPNGQVVPKNGIYAAWAHVAGRKFPAAVSVGTRPTFNGHGIKIEAHLLDGDAGNLYGQIMEVAFVARIRDELKFNSIPELTAEIERDIVKIKGILTQ